VNFKKPWNLGKILRKFPNNNKPKFPNFNGTAWEFVAKKIANHNTVFIPSGCGTNTIGRKPGCKKSLKRLRYWASSNLLRLKVARPSSHYKYNLFYENVYHNVVVT